ncbi:hypothetical protein ACFV3R_31975 [Streptomyces sp. NPDC059740]|uniref:hypothetical protein n=1 Tax=Streptomyces sp. NPDC059740 TaxID=3346926 RepID=UPI0036673991
MSEDCASGGEVARGEDGPRPGGPARNYGAQFFGGEARVANMAVGPHARADAGSVSFGQETAEAPDRALELLSRIEQLLTEHQGELPEQSGPRREVARLREELVEEEPQSGVVNRALARLSAFATPVAPLVTAVAQLGDAIGRMLH